MQDASADVVMLGQAARTVGTGGIDLGAAIFRGVSSFFVKEVSETAARLTVQDILSGAVREGGSTSEIWGKSGGTSRAAKDFANLDGGPAVTVGRVQVKELANGQGRAVLRTDPASFSSGPNPRPTVEIQPSGGGYKGVAIRYKP